MLKEQFDRLETRTKSIGTLCNPAAQNIIEFDMNYYDLGLLNTKLIVQ